jgi:4-carboxymuconolactone decarboxylase
MSRLPDLRRDQLTAEAQAVWDAIIGTRGSRLVTESGALAGPFNAFVHAPRVGRELTELGAALRFGTSLERRLTEIAIITVGAHWRAEFEWWAHARMAREHGVADAVVDAIGRGADPPFVAEDERIVHAVASQLVSAGRVDDDTYSDASRLVGDAGMVELIALCGYYTLISFVLNGFNVPVPPGVAAAWDRPGLPDRGGPA